MSQEKEQRKICACASSHQDLMRAPPPQRDWFRKVTCPNCKKVYWTNRETDYCFDCESKPQARRSLA